jgi:uncharacterized membrane protein
MTTRTARRDHRSALDVPLTVAYLALFGGAAFVTPVRLSAVLAAPLLFFLPGYAVLAALFPSRPHPSAPSSPLAVLVRSGQSSLTGSGMGWRERVVLSVPTSVAVLPFVVLGLSAVGAPLRSRPVLVSLSFVVLVGTFVGHVRRSRLPPDRRFGIPVGQWLADVRRGFDPSRPLDLAVNLALAAAVVFALAALGYGLVAPAPQTDLGEAALVTEQDGQYVAGGYPDVIPVDAPTSFTLSLQNRRAAPSEYAVVVVLELVETPSNGRAVTFSRELDRFDVAVAPRSTEYVTRSVSPTFAGEDLRVSYYVYTGEAPADPDADSALRHLFVWVDVEPPEPTAPPTGTATTARPPSGSPTTPGTATTSPVETATPAGLATGTATVTAPAPVTVRPATGSSDGVGVP